jgi:autotransporter-associated beta strand protein
VQLGDGVSFNGALSGSVVNNDTLIFFNPTAVTSAASISGSGVLIKRGAGTLTLSGTQSYTNLTTIEAGTLLFDGTPPAGDISNSSVLTFKPGGALTYAGTISGSGKVTAGTSSITLTLSGANTFSGGITVTTGNLLLGNNAAAGTGPLTNTSSGLIYLGNGVVVTNDYAITTSTTDLGMRCDTGTGTWAGNVYVTGGASWRPGSDGGTLVFTGTANQTTHNFIVPRGSVQLASNAVITSTGSATAFGRDTSGGNRSLNLTIRDNASVTLGPCAIGGGQAGNNVTVTIQNNALLSMPTNSLDVHNINRSTSVSTLRLNGGTLNVGGFIKTRTFTNVIYLNGGLLQANTNNGTFLNAFANQSAFVSAGGSRIDDGGFVIRIAQPLNHDPALPSGADGGLIKTGLGELILSAANTYAGPTRIMAGKLTLSGSGSIAASQNIYVGPASIFDVSAVSSGSVMISPFQTLSGDGVCNGNIVLGNGALLTPGTNAIGKLTFNNSVTLASGCTNIFEISSSPLTNDVAKVLGNLTNGGVLIVVETGATAPQRGDTFKLFDAASYNGSFSTVILPLLDSGLGWDTADLNSQGVIRVVARPPVFGGITSSGTDIVMSGSNGIAGGTYYVLTSTNLASPRELWIPLFTNQFGPAGEFSITNAFEPGTPARFYLLQVP